jgi:hypothetical protein
MGARRATIWESLDRFQGEEKLRQAAAVALGLTQSRSSDADGESSQPGKVSAVGRTLSSAVKYSDA